MSASFPTHEEMLEEFAAGLREHKTGHIAASGMDDPQAVAVSPFLRQPPVSYADFMAGREARTGK